MNEPCLGTRGVTMRRSKLNKIVSRSLLCVSLLASCAGSQSVRKTPADILKENDAALALIVSADDNSISLGSGFFIGDGSAVVTNFHVIAGAKAVVVKTGSGKVFRADSVYAFDEQKDLAVLRIPVSGTQTARLGDSEKVAIGSPIVVIGNPEGLEKSVSNGLISGVRVLDSQKLFQISAPISHGSSGGPVFDEDGKVIAIVCAMLRDGQNLNFAIPVNQLTEVWANRTSEKSLASLPASEPTRGSAAAVPDMDGAWAATFADSLSSGQLSLTMVQDGSALRGTYTSSLGGGGIINGQIAAGKFAFTLTQSVKDCPGTYVGTADIRANTMIGTFSGSDCQGAHTNGTFSMTRGSTPIQPSPSAPPVPASSQNPVIQYGNPAELKGVRTVFIYGVEPDVRNNMLKQFGKRPEVQVVGEIEKADVVLVFGAQFFSMGTHTNVWTDGNGNGWASTTPRYGVTGEGSAVKFVPPNTLRIVWQFSATRTTVFQRRPSTNFVRDFLNAWERANR